MEKVSSLIASSILLLHSPQTSAGAWGESPTEEKSSHCWTSALENLVNLHCHDGSQAHISGHSAQISLWR